MQETKMKGKALDKSNCAAARPGGKEAGVKAASSRTETGYEADGADEWAPHHEVPVSAPEVKPGVVPRKSRPLVMRRNRRHWRVSIPNHQVGLGGCAGPNRTVSRDRDAGSECQPPPFVEPKLRADERRSAMVMATCEHATNRQGCLCEV